jgi:hypothetical protein
LTAILIHVLGSDPNRHEHIARVRFSASPGAEEKIAGQLQQLSEYQEVPALNLKAILLYNQAHCCTATSGAEIYGTAKAFTPC